VECGDTNILSGSQKTQLPLIANFHNVIQKNKHIRQNKRSLRIQLYIQNTNLNGNSIFMKYESV